MHKSEYDIENKTQKLSGILMYQEFGQFQSDTQTELIKKKKKTLLDGWYFTCSSRPQNYTNKMRKDRQILG